MDIQKNAIARKLISEFKTEEEIIRHFAISLFYDKGCYLDTIAKPDTISQSKGYLTALTDVSRCVNIVVQLDIPSVIKEHDGYAADILLALIGNRLNPVAFALLESSTSMSRQWTNAVWELNKHKVNCLVTLMQIPTSFGSEFRREFRQQLNTTASIVK
jgi:hypothetical protein